MVICCALGLAASVLGQVSFMTSYGGPGSDVCNDLVVAADGSVRLAGSTLTPAFVIGSQDGFLVRTDLNGGLLGAAACGSPQTDVFTCVEALPDSGLFAVGYTTGYGATSFDCQVTRLDKNNAILWSLRIGGDEEDFPLASALTHDGGVVLYGIFGTSPTNTNHYVAKVSGAGALVWTRLLRAPGYDFGFSIERTPDNGFILCGESEAYGPNASHIFVAKLTADGDVTWRQVYATNGEDHGTRVIPTLDGGYAVAGYTFGYGATSGDAFLMKLNASGAISWFRRYGDGRYQVATSLVQMPDSSYWLSGTSSTGGFVNPNIFLIHTNKNGGLLSAQEFGDAMRTERANSMVIAPDGGLLIGGEVSNCPQSDFQALLLRTSPDGLCPACDQLNVVYTSSAHTPSIFPGFTLNTAGTSNVAVPAIQAVSPISTLCSGELPLPVQLLSFTGRADGSKNVLSWSTATERESDRFEVERSTDLSTWELVASAAAAGTSNSTLHYMVYDKAPTQLAYYRLRQVDLDGTNTFSEVVAVQRENGDEKLLLFPNPGVDQLTVRSPGQEPIEQVEIAAADGRVLLRVVSLVAQGSLDLGVDQLRSGTYFVRVASASGVRTATWVKVDR